MADITVEPVDPRDQDWEKDVVRYRVHVRDGDVSDEYELHAESVSAVVDWATNRAGDREWTLYAVLVDREKGTGLLRLEHRRA